MRLRTIGRALAYASMLVALLSLGYSLSWENRYLRVSHLINFDPVSKHFVNCGLISLACLAIGIVGSLLVKSNLAGVAVAVVSALLLAFQLSTVLYAAKAMPRSVEVYRRIWDDGTYSSVVEATLKCCGFEESHEQCQAKKPCRKKLTQQMKERVQRLWHGLGVSIGAQIGLVIATALVIKGSGKMKQGYSELPVQGHEAV